MSDVLEKGPNIISNCATGKIFNIPSPALAFVGRKNSGKTTLLVKLTEELTSRGLSVATLKHHGHPQFEIDVPGKDSWRHRQAGAKTTAILSEKSFALMRETATPYPWQKAITHFYNHDIVLVEGFRNTELSSVEIMRAANQRDQDYALTFVDSLNKNTRTKLPQAVVSDIPQVIAACKTSNISYFDPDDAISLANFVQENFLRPKLTIAIQAGGESKRMGQSKALVPFLNRPLIETIVERLEGIADELIITTNEQEKLQFLLKNHPQVKLVTDELNERGAMPGLITALHHATCPFISVVACDMVAVSPELIVNELNLLNHRNTEAVIPSTIHGVEPFGGVYRTKEFLNTVEQNYAAGNTRIRLMIDKMDAIKLTSQNPWGIEFPMGCFVNVNTPQELTFAERLIAAAL